MMQPELSATASPSEDGSLQLRNRKLASDETNTLATQEEITAVPQQTIQQTVNTQVPPAAIPPVSSLDAAGEYLTNVFAPKQKRQQTFEYKPADFLYNTRILVFLLCSIIPILSMAGKYTFSVLALGLLTLYVLDFLGMKRATLVAWWATLGVFWSSIYFSSFSFLWMSHFNVFVLMHGSLFIMLLGVWGTLQSTWFKTFSPELTLVCERALFSSLPIVSVPLIMSILVGINGIQNAPFYLAFVFCALVHYFVKPARSSFKAPLPQSNYTSPEELYVQRPIEVAILCAMTFTVPPIMYLATHYRTFDFGFGHSLNMSTLSSIPILLFSLFPESYLWWSDFLKDRTFYQLRTVLITATLCTLAAWVEYRVIFVRFPHLMALPPPYNYIIVTLATYAAISLFVLIVRGETSAMIRQVAIGLGAFAVACAAFVVGFPIPMIPFPALAAHQAASFYFTKSWSQYAIAAGTAAISLMWWLGRSFYFLDYEFELTMLPIEWTINIMHANVLIVLLFIIGAAILPLCLISTGPSGEALMTAVFIVHGYLLTMLEQLLYEQGEGFYSPMLIIATTALGMLVVYNLHMSQKLSVEIASTLMSLYAAKLGILLAPLRMAVIAAFIASLTITRLYLASQTGERLTPSMGWGYTIASGFSLFITKSVLVPSLLGFVMDTRYYNISESRVIGAALFLWGLNILPITYYFMAKNKPIRRFNILLLLLGATWTFWAPSLELSAKDIIDPDSLLQSNPEWVSWIILFIVTVSAAAFAAPIPKSISQLHIFKLIVFSIVAFGAGLAFCGTYLRFAPLYSYIFICASFCTVAFVLYALHYLTGDMFNLIYVSYGIFLFMFPITFMTITSSTIIHRVFAEELLRPIRVAIVGVYAALNVVIALMARFRLSGRPLLKISKKLAQAEYPSELDIGFIGNLATLVAALLIFTLIVWLDASNMFLYFLLAPIFLLLSKDKIVLSKITDGWRYALVCLLMQAVLLIAFSIDVIGALGQAASNTSLKMLVWDCGFSVFLFSLSLPAHILVDNFLLTLKRPNIAQIYIVIPFAAIPAILGTFMSVKLAGVFGVAAILFQVFTASQWVPIQQIFFG